MLGQEISIYSLSWHIRIRYALLGKRYCRLLPILQKVNGRTYEDIANEYVVDSRSVQRWVAAYIHGGIDEVKLKKPGGLKSSITSEDREIILKDLNWNCYMETIM
ncbi:MAG: helix-turn-helix domain-containing protein, partial [Candidatus Nitrosopolaris sp.]